MKVSEIDSNKIDKNIIKKFFYNIKKEEYESADYIIIYGCHIKEILDERLNHALNILKNKKINKVVLTGGIGIKGDFNESSYMYNCLLNNGINKDNIIIENKSKTTEENNINIVKLLNLNKITKHTKIVIVTHEIHMLRISTHYKKLINNNNIHFYYDYVNNSILSYEKLINNPSMYSLFKEQIEKTQKFISNKTYEDIDI